MEDKGDYDPPAMDGWKLVIENPSTGPPLPPPGMTAPPPPPSGMGIEGADGGGKPKPKIYWRARFEEENVSTRILPETPLWGVEKELLGMDQETEEYVLFPPPTRSGRANEGDERRNRRSSRIIDGRGMDGIIEESRDDRDDKKRRRKRRSMLEPELVDDGRR
jgi:hypothetical protein